MSTSATIQKKNRNLRIFCRVGRDINLNGRDINHQFGKTLHPDQDKFEDDQRDSSFGKTFLKTSSSSLPSDEAVPEAVVDTEDTEAERAGFAIVKNKLQTKQMKSFPNDKKSK